MVVFNNAMAGAAGSGGAAAGYEIERSLRFSRSDSAYLNKTFSAGNRKVWTWSGWVKRSATAQDDILFTAGDNASDRTIILFGAGNFNDQLYVINFRSGALEAHASVATFRDTSAWYHFVIAVDTTQTSANDRVKFWVNGVLQTWMTTNISQNVNTSVNNTVSHKIGTGWDLYSGDFYDGYLADVHFIDGLALPASAFGETDDNGVWQPKEYINPNNGTTWSNYVTGNSLYAYGPTRAFDGNLNTQAIPDRTGTSTPSTLTFTPPSAISGKVGIYFLANTNEDDSATISINGTDVSSTLRAVQAAGGSQPWYYEFDSITSLSSIAWTAETGFDGWNVFGITINGMLLVDGWNQYNDGTFYSNYGVSVNADPTPRLWTHAFDGSDGSYVTGDGSSNNQSLWTYPNGITVNTSLRLKLAGGTNSFVYVNGSQVAGVTSTSTSSPTWYTVTGVSNLTSIGVGNNGSTWSTLHQIEVDGTVLTDTGTVGRNSFHLKFNDASSKDALGTDSANGNDWTPNNFEVGPNNTLTAHSHVGTTQQDPTSNFVDGDITNQYRLNSSSGNTDASFTFGTTLSGTIEVLFSNGNTQCTGLISIDNGASYTALATSASPAWTNLGTINNNNVRLRCTFNSGGGSTVTFYAIKVDGVVVTAFGDSDSLFDSPTNGDPTLDTGLGGELPGNYATLNPLSKGSAVTLSDGNLQHYSTDSSWGGPSVALSGFGMTAGKWYWECTIDTSTYSYIGIAQIGKTHSYMGGDANSCGYLTSSGSFVGGGAGTANPAVVYTANAVLMFAYDADAKKFWIGQNGTWFSTGGNVGDPANGNYPTHSGFGSNGEVYTPGTSTYSTVTTKFNFGQRPFAYSAPTGFKSLCTANLPTPDIEDGSTAFDAAIYSGNSGDGLTTTQDIPTNFSPDMVWIKSRTDTNGHVIFDTIRGAGKRVFPHLDVVENTKTQTLSTFNPDGFTVNGDNSVNDVGVNYVAWAWDAGEPPTADNSAGAGNVPTTGSVKIDGVDLTSALPGTLPVTRMAVNRTAGFSMFSYTGTGVTETIYHGLDKQPDMLIVKCRSAAKNWGVWHSGLTQPSSGNGYYLILNGATSPGTDGENNAFPYWYSTSFNSSTFTLGATGGSNELDATFIAYAFSAIPGYSSFGKFTGNGATGWPNADGPFVYTGMRPRWIMVKCTSQAEDWLIYDSARDTYNYADEKIRANSSAIAASVTNHEIDILSNGFKVRNNNGGWNQNGATYIYAAFAEHPFRHSRAR